MPASKLTRPTIDVQDSYLEALREYHDEDRYLRKNIDTISSDFQAYIDMLQTHQGHPEEIHEDWVEEVPQTILWLVKDGEYYGTLNIRTRLNWHLERYGGHISFIIRPSKRNMGFGKRILQKSLPVANTLGLEKALMTVRPENHAGVRIIEYVGGVLQDTTQATDRFPSMHRYWIDCT